MGKLQLCLLAHKPHGDNPNPKTLAGEVQVQAGTYS